MFASRARNADHSSLVPPLLVAGGCLVVWGVCRLAGIPAFPFGVLIPVLCIASVTDLSTRRIPNWLTYSALGFALSGAAVVSFGTTVAVPRPDVVPGLRESVRGFAACFGIMLLVYYLSGTGAGDVKLAGVIGACVGVRAGVDTLLWTHLIAGTVMLAVILVRIGPVWLVRQLLFRLLPDRFAMPVESHAATLSWPVPMAVFFSLGTACALLEVPLT